MSGPHQAEKGLQPAAPVGEPAITAGDELPWTTWGQLGGRVFSWGAHQQHQRHGEAGVRNNEPGAFHDRRKKCRGGLWKRKSALGDRERVGLILHPVCFGAKRSKGEETSEGTDIMMDAERCGARGRGVKRSLEPVWASQQ